MTKLPTLLLSLFASGLGAQTVPCVSVPGETFRPATGLLAKGLPADARLAGAGRTLGVLVPKLPDGHTLLLIRGERVVREYWLAAPKDRPFSRTPGFYLADNGNIVILRSREYFAVYVSSTLTAVVDGELAHSANVTGDRSGLVWGPSPSGQDPITTGFLMKKDLDLFKSDEWPALLVRSELDGSDQQVMLRLDKARLAKLGTFPPSFHELRPVLRPDGKMWLAGRFTDEIMLADSNGRILRSVTMPSALKRPEDDPEVRKKMDEEDQRETERMLAAKTGEATKRPPRETKAFSFNKSPLFRDAHSRGRDLVLTLATYEPPSGSIVVIRDGEDTIPCFQFPEKLRGKGDSAVLQSTVTEDAVWFREPFGFIAWDDLDALLEPKKEPEPAAR